MEIVRVRAQPVGGVALGQPGADLVAASAGRAAGARTRGGRDDVRLVHAALVRGTSSGVTVAVTARASPGRRGMPSFTNLLVVSAVAFGAPLLLGLFPRLGLPSVVLE